MAEPRQGGGRIALAVANRAPLRSRRHILFLLAQHRTGNFSRPLTFTEKVNWRILNDRREVLRLTCDKLHSKKLACDAGLPVPNLLWSGERLEDLAGMSLGGRWVLKPNDGSRWVAFGQGRAPGHEELLRVVRRWPARSGPDEQGEWAYSHARRLYIVEERIGSPVTTPTSYKFFVFDGEPLYVHAISVSPSRFAQWMERPGERWPPPSTALRLYTPSWDPLDAQLGTFPIADITAPPSDLQQMLDAARLIARPYDFMRVDFMHDGNSFYFGELTPYPHGGLTPLRPRRFELELGAHWRLPNLAQAQSAARQSA